MLISALSSPLTHSIFSRLPTPVSHPDAAADLQLVRAVLVRDFRRRPSAADARDLVRALLERIPEPGAAAAPGGAAGGAAAAGGDEKRDD